MEQLKSIATAKQFDQIRMQLESMSDDLIEIMLEDIKRSPSKFLEVYFAPPTIKTDEFINDIKRNHPSHVHIERGYDDPNHVDIFNKSAQLAVSNLEKLQQ